MSFPVIFLITPQQKKSLTILQEPPPNFPLLSFISILPFTILFITLLPPTTPINTLPLPFPCGPANQTPMPQVIPNRLDCTNHTLLPIPLLYCDLNPRLP